MSSVGCQGRAKGYPQRGRQSWYAKKAPEVATCRRKGLWQIEPILRLGFRFAVGISLPKIKNPNTPPLSLISSICYKICFQKMLEQLQPSVKEVRLLIWQQVDHPSDSNPLHLTGHGLCYSYVIYFELHQACGNKEGLNARCQLEL